MSSQKYDSGNESIFRDKTLVATHVKVEGSSLAVIKPSQFFPGSSI
jgi:hypothetical protein